MNNLMFGSQGERELQRELGSEERAQSFYDGQVRDHLTLKMQALIRRQEMVFVATADAQGHCDCSPRFGAPGFVSVLDKITIAYPEFRGNGVFASMGNIQENPHTGLLFLDFLETTVGLHVNGTARICEVDDAPASLVHGGEDETTAGPLVERWIVIKVEEAYIHCSKHVPHLGKRSKHIQWGTDDPNAKSSGYFMPGDSAESTGSTDGG